MTYLGREQVAGTGAVAPMADLYNSSIAGTPSGDSFRLGRAWPQVLGTVAGASVVLLTGYGALEHVGTNPSVVDLRPLARVTTGPAKEPSKLRGILARSVADQTREALAALSLNKSQLAEVLGVSRPTLYDWLDGKEPNRSNANRLTTLVNLLMKAGVTSGRPLSPRFVRQALTEGDPTLWDALVAEPLNERSVAELLQVAKASEDKAASSRIKREKRLSDRGFDEVTDDQRRELLARNMAMRDWPKS